MSAYFRKQYKIVYNSPPATSGGGSNDNGYMYKESIGYAQYYSKQGNKPK